MTIDSALTIRPMSQDDLMPLYRLLSDESVMRYIEPPYDLDKTRSFLAEAGLSESPLIQAVEDSTEAFVGYVIYHPYDSSSMEIGWVLAPEVWGRGYAQKLTKQMTAMAFSQGRDAVLECSPQQETTKHIAVKLGYRYLGLIDELEVFKMERERLPESIEKALKGEILLPEATGMSRAKVLVGENAVLKIEERSPESDNEALMLAWLQRKLPVPKLLEYEVQDGKNYLLMSRAEGDMACCPELMEQPQVLCDIMAEALKKLWSVNIGWCPVDVGAEALLNRAEYNVTHGLVDIENAEPETFGPGGFKDPEELLAWLKEHQPQEDRALVHGDLCLPNVFVKDANVSAFIDLGRCGVGDKYKDIAICYRSLCNNFGGKYGKAYPGFKPSMLFNSLGIEPDWDKIKFYILLDELF